MVNQLIATDIEIITENPLARMKWKHYEREIVQLHHVYIVGWLDDIPFTNLSLASNGKPALIRLLRAWKDGTTRWCRLTPAEAFERVQKLEASYASGSKTAPAARKERSDRGKKRARRVQEEDSDSSSDGAGPSTSKRRVVE